MVNLTHREILSIVVVVIRILAVILFIRNDIGRTKIVKLYGQTLKTTIDLIMFMQQRHQNAQSRRLTVVTGLTTTGECLLRRW